VAKSFSPPPLDHKFVDEDGNLTQEWRMFFSDMFQTNEGLASQAGVTLPTLTTTQRDAANTSLTNIINQSNIPSGLMIYNSTDNELQVYFSTLGWRSVYTT
tara:strand:- start:165 stop:467 length:303 start_codon:yes stop_codon:yes gene_type:complete